MAPSIYDLLKTFDPQNKFDGTNYPSWIRELEMTFSEDATIYAHITGTSLIPSDTSAATNWRGNDTRARMALYKTISSNAVRDAHFKNTVPAQTAGDVFASLKSEYQKDSRAARFELKKRLYNPVHDPSQPVSIYIQDIIAASDALTLLGHSPSSLDVVDSILMNLDTSFSIVRTLLTSQSDEPSLSAVKKMLTDQEDTRLALSGGDLEIANYVRKGRKSKHSPDSDNDSDGPSYDWLNPQNNDVCHRCGLPGHRSSRCIADMPQKIKDKIIKGAKDRRRNRDSSPVANKARYIASDASSDVSESEEEAHWVGGVEDRPPSNSVGVEARRLLQRLQV